MLKLAPHTVSRLGLGTILGLVVATGLGCMAPDVLAGRKSTGARGDDAAPADAFLQARQAALADNAAGLEQSAARALEHPLGAAYVPYWRLKLRLNDRRQDGAPALESDVEKFLAERAGSFVGDQLRRDWMFNLGRRGEWDKLETHYPKWLQRDDLGVQCWLQVGRLARGGDVAAARDTVFQTREFGEACGTLLDTMARSGAMRREDLWRRLVVALEANTPATIRRVGLAMGLDGDALDDAIQRPQRTLVGRAAREYTVIALVRLSRQDLRAALDRAASAGLSPADRALVSAELAAASMRRLDPDALTLTREGLTAADVGDESLGWMARAALRGQDWKMLSAIIAKMSPDLQRDPAWVYWRARTQIADGRKDEGETLLRGIAGQHHFYGQLAGEELGQLTLAPPRAPVASDIELAEADRNEGLRRALRFYELGLRPEGNREWNFQLRAMNDRQLLAAAEHACRRKVLDRCVNTADRTQTEHDFTLRFISPFLEQLKPVAATQGLDPAWIYGLIRQESRFIMDARSHVGATGLMQMMPATGRWVARKLGVGDFRPEHLNDLDTNLRFGTFYLRSVFDDLEGSPLLASAAYNAGPNRPRAWRATLPAAVEGAVFAEIIPFHETRDYVKKVLSNATYYAALFTGQPQSLKQRLGQVVPKVQAASELP